MASGGRQKLKHCKRIVHPVDLLGSLFMAQTAFLNFKNMFNTIKRWLGGNYSPELVPSKLSIKGIKMTIKADDVFF